MKRLRKVKYCIYLAESFVPKSRDVCTVKLLDVCFSVFFFYRDHWFLHDIHLYCFYLLNEVSFRKCCTSGKCSFPRLCPLQKLQNIQCELLMNQVCFMNHENQCSLTVQWMKWGSKIFEVIQEFMPVVELNPVLVNLCLKAVSLLGSVDWHIL